ncbi:metal ABC transporter permease [Desulforhopalus singaporensis]|uniref:Zinc transport system permease protein n=1 Tax=Desulforhopalus singaporensis TaxID=91360 RepID=A0A1H0QCL4_9BACT|nr:iron chelate uptake ABC transporter family permease subunit [Desulforhopalus singaporensis]SDP14439.1 zinc transport system permease protein [Desulforhopalus singaporensis]
MIEVLHYEFMRHALLAGLLAAVVCGVIGTLVIVNRLVFLSGGVAHSAYGGVGLAFFLGWPYMIGATLFAFGSAMIMAAVSIKSKQRTDTIIGVMWSVGMAAGILLLDLAPGYNVDLMSYLFGSILSVPAGDLVVMAIVTLVVLLLVAYFYSDLLLMSYDEEFAEVKGVPVRPLYFMLIGMVAVTVVMVVQVVGLILVIALLTIPPYITEKYTRSLLQMMVFSSLLGMGFILGGLWASYIYDLTSGAAIIFVAGTVFFLSLGVDKLIAMKKRRVWLRSHQSLESGRTGIVDS